MRGVLIVNTGSPKNLTKEDVKWFIGAMLSDPLVMSTIPDWFRPILAKRIIAPLRASKSLSHYDLIWDKEHSASPLIYHTLRLAEKVEQESDMSVEVAMRYGEPEVSVAFERLMEKCPSLHEVVVVPMFPQYAQSSYQTTVDYIGQCFMKQHYPFRLKFVSAFYNHIGYIKALAESLKPHVKEEYDRLVFSFHSLPLVHVEEAWKKGKDFDYVYQIKETVRLVTKELNIDPKKNRIVYSSAMGKDWLEPDLDVSMKDFAQSGVKKVIAITPGFPADNLETLFDIDIQARNIFMKHGGQKFTFVRGLNSEDYWVEGVIRIITDIV